VSQTVIASDLYCSGTITGKNNVPSAGAVGDAQIAAAAAVQATKLIHQWTRTLDQAPGASIVAQSKIVHAVVGANLVAANCGIASIAAVVDAAATGDHTATIDVLKRNGAGAWASILSAPLVISVSTAAGVVQTLAVAQAGLVTGDLLKITVAVAGSTGVQAQGLLVEIAIREYPQ